MPDLSAPLNWRDSNNCEGWFYCYLSHIICSCGFHTQEKALPFLLKEASDAKKSWWQHRGRVEAIIKGYVDGVFASKEEARAKLPNYPEFDSKYMSDNQCVMMCNHWFYQAMPDDIYVANGHVFRFDQEALDWWLDRNNR